MRRRCFGTAAQNILEKRTTCGGEQEKLGGVFNSQAKEKKREGMRQANWGCLRKAAKRKGSQRVAESNKKGPSENRIGERPEEFLSKPWGLDRPHGRV